MEKPKFGRSAPLGDYSLEGPDIFFNSDHTGQVGNLSLDLEGKRFYTKSFYFQTNLFGFHFVSAEKDDPCRIAYEFGEIEEIDFWSRFGFVWEATPTTQGQFEISRVPIHQVQDAAHRGWCREKESPIAYCESIFKLAMTRWNQMDPNVIAVKARYPLFLEEIPKRRKQWEELKKKVA